MPPAARVSDMHSCLKGGPELTEGDPTVLIGFQPAARKGDNASGGGASSTIAEGEPTILIGKREAARVGDSMNHGGTITFGCPTVLFGASAQAQALRTDKPFCAECERARQERSHQG